MEKSKTIIFIGQMVGIKATKKSQRGIIGKMFRKFRDAEIEKGLHKINLNSKGIKINDYMDNKTYYI